MSENIENRLCKDPKLLGTLKACFDNSVKTYVGNGLLPQSLADEMIQNTTGRDVLKWVMAQTESAPCIRIPTEKQIIAQRDLPLFHDNRPDYLDARIAALCCSNAPLPDYNAFVKIIPTEE